MKKFKNLILLFFCTLILTSCASTKIFETGDNYVVAKPYGWANKKAVKDDRVVYQVNPGNTIISVLGIQTLVLPVWLTGWQLYEPVKLKEQK